MTALKEENELKFETGVDRLNWSNQNSFKLKL